MTENLFYYRKRALTGDDNESFFAQTTPIKELPIGVRIAFETEIEVIMGLLESYYDKIASKAVKNVHAEMIRSGKHTWSVTEYRWADYPRFIISKIK